MKLSQDVVDFLEGIPYPAVVLDSEGVVVAQNTQMVELVGTELAGPRYNRWEVFQYMDPDQLQSALTSTASVPIRLHVGNKSVTGDMKSFICRDLSRMVMITVPRTGGLLSMFRKLNVAMSVDTEIKEPAPLDEGEPV